MTPPSGPWFSVVIPAHDEEARIGPTLAFAADLEPGEAEVLVVANGCTDRTVERARPVPGVHVVEIETPSKTEALNRGDEVARCFPRIYVDADVALGADDLRSLARAVKGDEARLAAPRAHLRRSGCSRLVRAYFEVFEMLPHGTDGLSGCGVYALSGAGRARFDRFPAVTADDLFVERLFDRSERSLLSTAEAAVQVPRTLRALVAVRTRVAYGNRQLAHLDAVGAVASAPSRRSVSSTSDTVRGLLRLVARQPRLLPAAVVFVVVTALARVRSRGRSGASWHRDLSTR